MVICNFFLQGRCRYGDRCWNEHPRGGGGGRQEQQSRYHQQPPAGSRTWTSPNQRYVQPSNVSKSTTWSRDNSQTSYAQHSDSHDNRSRHYNSGSSAGSFSNQNQNRYSNLPSQDFSKDTHSDKDGSLFEDIKRDLDAWESSGQWIFSAYCVSKDTSNATGFADISPEELRLEFYTARDSGNMQNYVNSVQQLATQWKQRVHAIKNANISAQTALINELTKPAVSSAPMFGGQQNSSFPTTTGSGTWSRDNRQTSYAQHSDSGSSAESFTTQNQFSTMPFQDHSRDTQLDKDESIFEDIKRDLDAWESSGQWIFSVYCISEDSSNVTGFADISPEELRLECYTARESENIQNYVISVQQLATQWKQRVHAIKNTNISAQAALINELTKPAVGFEGQENSSFSTTSSSTSSAPQSASSFSFKPDSQAPSPFPVFPLLQDLPTNQQSVLAMQ
ncbi:nucleoporin NUP42 isoform X2 [Rana temporaria]|uniref:nucleoporin NUP42 isoform X2 n=1 Tax=Rana temporaria TaxID=8407 RepID=UPI001AAD3EC9|nr:nucleoporin NUP42 isoform X2 [Rana temporaria]